MWPASPVTCSASAFPRALGVGLLLPARASRPRPRAGVASARWAAAAAAAGGVRASRIPERAVGPRRPPLRLWRARCAVGKAPSTAAREAGPLRWCDLGLSALLPSLGFSIRTVAPNQMIVCLWPVPRTGVRVWSLFSYVSGEGWCGFLHRLPGLRLLSSPKY